MSNSLISVIIPVYNVESYLERCLDSVVNNTYKNIEIICVNDGSTDNCQAILEKYAAKDSRMKVIVQENRGLSAARNTGIDSASGDYIFFLDSDDWIHERTIELLTCVAVNSGSDMIVGGYMEVNNPIGMCDHSISNISDPIEIKSIEDYFASSSSRVTVWGTLYRSDKLRDIKFPDKKGVSEDNIYHTLILSQKENFSVAQLDIALYYYYIARADSIMKTSTADVFMRNAKWLVEYLDSMTKKKYAIDSILSFMFSYSYASRFYANRKVAKANIRECFRKLDKHLKKSKLSGRQLIKMIIVRYLQFLHRKIILMRDKSYLVWEENVASHCSDKRLIEYKDL